MKHVLALDKAALYVIGYAKPAVTPEVSISVIKARGAHVEQEILQTTFGQTLRLLEDT